MYYSVLQITTPVLLCTTKNPQRTTPVLVCKQSTTPVLQRTTPVLLRYYSVLQSTTTYYSSTTLYYKVLLQYYSVLLQYDSVLTKNYASTTLYYPVLQCTTLYYKVLQRTAPVLFLKRHFQCVEQVKSPSNITKYCACHAKWTSSTICVTYETSFPMRGATRGSLPTSPTAAPATQNECHHWSASHMKRHFQCVEQVKSPSNITKYCACHEILKLKIWAETPWSASANRKDDSRIIRG